MAGVLVMEKEKVEKKTRLMLAPVISGRERMWVQG
jgi:hypothetical protein